MKLQSLLTLFGSVLKLAQNEAFVNAMLQSDELSDEEKQAIRELRDSLKDEWDGMAPKA